MTEKPIAYDAYQKLADQYAARIDTKPHNAYCERPAMLAMWPDVKGRKVLDAGCGPGVYAEALLARGAQVISFDVSDRMVLLARERLGGNVDLRLIDMNQPLDMFSDNQFDLVNAPLCLDYVEDWRAVLSEFCRVLKPGGHVQFSCGHPAFDAEYFDTHDYFSVERVECMWTGFGIDVNMPSYRRSMEEVIMPVINAGLVMTKFVEPLPTDEFKRADPKRYASLMHRPLFLCIQARKG